MRYPLLFRVIIVAVWVVMTATASATPNPYQGYDVLGLAKYCRTFLAAPKREAVSTLLDTFGDPLPCIERAARRRYLKLVQIDLRDATCIRNPSCKTTAPELTDWGYLRTKVAKVNTLARKYKSIQWWISPFLEHDFTDEQIIKRACAIVRANCSRCFCINSPFNGVAPEGIPIELHGTKKRAFSISADGESSFNADNLISDGNSFEHYIAGDYNTFAWWPELNLRCDGETKWVPVLTRSERPTIDQFRHADLLLRPEQSRPKPPKRCKKVVTIRSEIGELSKTNGTQTCNGKPNRIEGNRPVLFLRRIGKRGERLPVYDAEGREVGCYAYTSTSNGLSTYSIGRCSGETPEALYRALGGEWGWVDLGVGNCLEINAIRRIGNYR